ncbi:HAMP domain-containing histidine kinase [Dissulfurirhabdus thermomarina]|uniref:histidine kinase n=1 Tax=Dissulfurirhabdus thermomarina TaxID=1765737 RepID=A0A6N9TNR1_DISTH|nr:HAMP domain-containing sensor histidine kinase [Dissulfurirhabdus thermomarina]NDY42932.1 HAMP domain-containing histidine kinase [Dissulfurirhabdus thermomarina]NMX23214.1 HAMP domain-containing histidine kinase [Dissulfurirhabdus thermomarina]
MPPYTDSADPPELSSVLSRIRKKRDDYEIYNFDKVQGRALRAFFDLAQEFETLDNFYRVCVFVPKVFMGFDSCLYLVQRETGRLLTVCDSLNGLNVRDMPPPEGIRLEDRPYELEDSYVIPIRGNRRLIATLPVDQWEEIIGVYEVFPLGRLDAGDRLFFEKYANRIGYNLHYKQMALQNVRHLRFIATLVADIEHNVLVPNMHYQVFFRDLRRRIGELERIAQGMAQKIEEKRAEDCPDLGEMEALQQSLSGLSRQLLEQYEAVEKHYRNTSLFLESLLRRDHFERGQLVPRIRQCNVRREVIDPQLARYRERLERSGIRIDDLLGGVPADEDYPLSVDVGLLSQVYANFFSNALKYCREVTNEHGEPVKFMAYGREMLPDFFGPGKHGVKFNVFTTGPAIPDEEAGRLYEEGYRARSAAGQPGSGHGLHFVKKVVEVHGGVTGYEPRPLGNNFFFILPLSAEIPSPEELAPAGS